MTTLENIKVQIAAKPGWIRTVEQSHKHVSDTDREFTFQIYFKDSDNVVRDTFCKVYASAFGTASEAAEIVGTIPDLATEPTKVSKSQYFAYDDSGLKIYPYVG